MNTKGKDASTFRLVIVILLAGSERGVVFSLASVTLLCGEEERGSK